MTVEHYITQYHFFNNSKWNDCVIDPVCEVILPTANGLDATLVCQMTYEWQARARQYPRPPNLDVSLSWTGVSRNIVRTRADPAAYSETVETRRPIENILPSTITSHKCTITFNFSPGSNEFVQYAVNPVSYTYTCQPPTDWRKCNFTSTCTWLYSVSQKVAKFLFFEWLRHK